MGRKSNFTRVLILLIMSAAYYELYSCGGGMVPYVPTQSGASGANSATSHFFMIDKGVSADMFDVKKLQPLIRQVVVTGNERKEHQAVYHDSTKTVTDVDSSCTATYHNLTPVLNLHRLH